MERLAAFILACLLLDLAVCQIHLGPIGDSQEVTCYECDGHGPGHEFPECSNHHAHKCHHDEVCRIVYGDKTTSFRCQKSQDCHHEMAHPMRNCTGGGVEARPDECQKCCSDSQCVDDWLNLMKLESMTSPDLLCPGECHDDEMDQCVQHAHRCHKDQFCQVSQDHGRIKGECKPDHEYHHCREELDRHSCHGGHHPGRCFMDCCATNDCLQKTFGAYRTTPTTMAPTTAAAGTNAAASLWERLHGDCKDQLVAEKCQELMAAHDVCHDRLALSICPESCGLCSAINSTACSDVVVNDGCNNLLQHEDVCTDKMAVFICPDTCQLCDELINSVITSLVEGNSSATDVPATLLPPSADPSSYPTFDCNDLKDVDCGILDGLCASSFMKIVCPDNCALCGSQRKADDKEEQEQQELQKAREKEQELGGGDGTVWGEEQEQQMWEQEEREEEEELQQEEEEEEEADEEDKKELEEQQQQQQQQEQQNSDQKPEPKSVPATKEHE